jgi:transcriptional regulator with GAF, ATPase, and Fis domain
VVSKEELAKFIPNVEVSSLPMVIHNETENAFTDRELLYKMIFDIKHDLNDLKRFVWNMSNGNADDSKIDFSDIMNDGMHKQIDVSPKHLPHTETANGTPTIILKEDPNYEVSTVDSNLSLAEMEKNMIVKALEKHRGKRRDAALDLGISERTLYRKIKEYDLEK